MQANSLLDEVILLQQPTNINNDVNFMKPLQPQIFHHPIIIIFQANLYITACIEKGCLHNLVLFLRNVDEIKVFDF